MKKKRKEERDGGRKETKDDRNETTICGVRAQCMLDAFIRSITFTSQGPWKVVFFLKRKKEILGEFLVALQYDCSQITALMLPVINRKFF